VTSGFPLKLLVERTEGKPFYLDRSVQTLVDRRFIEQGDMLAALDTRPNLMDLTPAKFENVVSNLCSGRDEMLTEADQSRAPLVLLEVIVIMNRMQAPCP
jgi:hypothetical protein